MYLDLVYSPMIQSFGNGETEKVFNQQWSKRLPNEIQRRAFIKLLLLDSAESIQDLRVPPSNSLENLKGQQSTEYSIRINRQWRICFRFDRGHAYDVRIEDYH